MQLISDKKRKAKRDEFDKLVYGSNYGFNNRDYKAMRLFGQLDQPFEELIKLIDKYVDEKYKINVIYGIINSILGYSRPVQSLKETVELYKSLECLDKMAFYMGEKDNTTEGEAKIKLLEMVKESKHFKKSH